jgi:hypothetical protein
MISSNKQNRIQDILNTIKRSSYSLASVQLSPLILKIKQEYPSKTHKLNFLTARIFSPVDLLSSLSSQAGAAPTPPAASLLLDFNL